MNQTTNFGLNQWNSTDRIQMEDFNADNAKIDAALKSLQVEHVYTGSFVGNGVTGRTISLPFTPKFLIVIGYYGESSDYCAFSFVTPTNELCATKNNLYFSTNVTIVENGFKLNQYNWHNVENYTEQYVAFQ